MMTKDVKAAMGRARYEILADDGSRDGEIKECPGVYANAVTLDKCRDELEQVLKEWILFRVYKNLEIPPIGRTRIDIPKQASVGQYDDHHTLMSWVRKRCGSHGARLWGAVCLAALCSCRGSADEVDVIPDVGRFDQSRWETRWTDPPLWDVDLYSSGSGGRETADLPAVEIPDADCPGDQFHPDAGSEDEQILVGCPDLVDSEVSGMAPIQFPQQPQLCGVQLQPGEYAYGNEYHKQQGLTSPYDIDKAFDRVAYYPKRMWLLPDGKTLRVAVVWLNGTGISVGDVDGRVPDQHLHSTYCWKPIPTVLPTGFAYWDVDTVTQQVSFVGQTVLAPSDYRFLIYGEPFYLAAGVEPTPYMVPWVMEVTVGDQRYDFSSCPTMGQLCRQDSYPGSGGWNPDWLLFGEATCFDPPPESLRSMQLHYSIVFSRREIWSLRRFAADGTFLGAVPLPISVHQLPEEKIWRSGCHCQESVPAVDWSCSPEGPFQCYVLRHVDPPCETCRCSGGPLSDMPPAAAQFERPFRRVYHLPHEGGGGLFMTMSRPRSFLGLDWHQFDNAPGLQCRDGAGGTLDSWPALSSSDQSVWLADMVGGSHWFPDQCARYWSALIYNGEPTCSSALCYDKPNSLCSGVQTCTTIESVDWSFNGLVKYRATRIVEEPQTYPDATQFTAYGLDPRVPCDVEMRMALPLWDW